MFSRGKRRGLIQHRSLCGKNNCECRQFVSFDFPCSFQKAVTPVGSSERLYKRRLPPPGASCPLSGGLRLFQPSTASFLLTPAVTASKRTRYVSLSRTLLFPPSCSISALPIGGLQHRKTVVILLCALRRFPIFLPFHTLLESRLLPSTRDSDIRVQRSMGNQTLFLVKLSHLKAAFVH